ncbi:Uncharacterized protein Fot_13467 [Forsythia ovata]|uniref:PGG domain-containing protein n=1 Tax=Forsythia ovata TaxID=205694 RepID=A0ABD1W3K0_9LAMI
MARNNLWLSSSYAVEIRKMDDRIASMAYIDGNFNPKVDLTKSLKAWSVIAKRCRKVTVASTTKISSLEENQLWDDRCSNNFRSHAKNIVLDVRIVVIVVALLITTTYHAILRLPGRVYQDDANNNNNVTKIA